MVHAHFKYMWIMRLSLVHFRFVIGYCLDFNEVFRDLKPLAVINEVCSTRLIATHLLFDYNSTN